MSVVVPAWRHEALHALRTTGIHMWLHQRTVGHRLVEETYVASIAYLTASKVISEHDCSCLALCLPAYSDDIRRHDVCTLAFCAVASEHPGSWFHTYGPQKPSMMYALSSDA